MSALRLELGVIFERPNNFPEQKEDRLDETIIEVKKMLIKYAKENEQHDFEGDSWLDYNDFIKWINKL